MLLLWGDGNRAILYYFCLVLSTQALGAVFPPRLRLRRDGELPGRD